MHIAGKMKRTAPSPISALIERKGGNFSGRGLASASRAARLASRKHRCAGRRDEGRLAKLKSRIRLAVSATVSSAASALPTAKITPFERFTSRCAIPIARTSIASNSFAG